MPTIRSDLVPYISPELIFDEFTSNPTLSVRYMYTGEPPFFPILNRAPSDLEVRQLIIAKALGRLSAAFANRMLFPFLIQPKLTDVVTVPSEIIHDMHLIVPSEYKNLRLAYVVRLSGDNPPSCTEGGYTGSVRFVFAADRGSSTYQVFCVDYLINSSLDYQRSVVSVDYSTIYGSLGDARSDSGLTSTFAGQITFKTLDSCFEYVRAFLDYVVYSGGPTAYIVQDNVSGDFSSSVLAYGSGLLIDGAYNLTNGRALTVKGNGTVVTNPTSSINFVSGSTSGTPNVAVTGSGNNATVTVNFGSNGVTVKDDSGSPIVSNATNLVFRNTTTNIYVDGGGQANIVAGNLYRNYGFVGDNYNGDRRIGVQQGLDPDITDVGVGGNQAWFYNVGPSDFLSQFVYGSGWPMAGWPGVFEVYRNGVRQLAKMQYTGDPSSELINGIEVVIDYQSSLFLAVLTFDTFVSSLENIELRVIA